MHKGPFGLELQGEPVPVEATVERDNAAGHGCLHSTVSLISSGRDDPSSGHGEIHVAPVRGPGLRPSAQEEVGRLNRGIPRQQRNDV